MNILQSLSLENKVVLITGGRQLYGKSSSIALAQAKATLYIATHSIEKALPFIEELNKMGGKAYAVQFDQEDPVSIKKMIDHVISQQGRIDVFINASRVKLQNFGWNQKMSDLEYSIRCNGAAFLYMNRIVGQQMIKQKSGSMILFGSMMGLVGVESHNYDGADEMKKGAYSHDYAIIKSGVNGWTRHAASYYGRYGIRVNAICPGGLETPDMNPSFVKNYSLHTQLGRLADNEDIKGIVVFLASDTSKYITGAILPVDGGYVSI
ncbi:MAG: SDR family oxidoreductase [Clostridia bacterium]|nr:SDR family oxidoreductase [Clostridia bacterium]